MDTDINSHTDETVMESYAKISLDDLSRFLLVSNVLFPRVCEPVSHKFQTIYPPSCEGSKRLPRLEESEHPPQRLQMLYRDIALLETLLVLKLYVNAIQSPVHYYQVIKKPFLSPSGIEPATDVLCHNISVAIPTLLSS